MSCCSPGSSDGNVRFTCHPSHCQNKLNSVILSTTDCQLHHPSELLHPFCTKPLIVASPGVLFCSEQCNSSARMDSMTSWSNMSRELRCFYIEGVPELSWLPGFFRPRTGKRAKYQAYQNRTMGVFANALLRGMLSVTRELRTTKIPRGNWY